MSLDNHSPKTVSIFGATGSIGSSTLDIIRAHKTQFSVRVLTAHKNIDQLEKLAKEFSPELVVVGDEEAANHLKEQLKLDLPSLKILWGEGGLIEAARVNVDIHIAAIMGFAGLKPMIEGMPHCKKMAIANKEPLVAAGPFIKHEAQKHAVTLLPIDSEHNAIFQVFEKSNRKQITRIYLTASGGAFRDLTLEECETKTIDEALQHPNWSMGKKITIDSATMVNKALEIIEAHELFDLDVDQIEVLLHPQSVIHGMVEYEDGSILSQMGPADMRTPIAYTLGFPNRIKTTGAQLPLNAAHLNLQLSKLDDIRFPAVTIAKTCTKEGLDRRIAFNAINELLVDAFLCQKIAFGRIVPYIELMLGKLPRFVINSLDDIYAWDHSVRTQTTEFLNSLSS